MAAERILLANTATVCVHPVKPVPAPSAVRYREGIVWLWTFPLLGPPLCALLWWLDRTRPQTIAVFGLYVLAFGFAIVEVSMLRGLDEQRRLVALGLAAFLMDVATLTTAVLAR